MQPQQGYPININPAPQGQVQPNPGYQNPMVNPQPATVVVHEQKIIGDVGTEPQVFQCPVCHRQQRSIIAHHKGTGTWIWFIVLLIVFWPVAWVPFVWSKCQDTHHICPNCGTVLARKKACC